MSPPLLGSQELLLQNKAHLMANYDFGDFSFCCVPLRKNHTYRLVLVSTSVFFPTVRHVLMRNMSRIVIVLEMAVVQHHREGRTKPFLIMSILSGKAVD